MSTPDPLPEEPTPSAARIAANRQNAQKSTGPRTPAGKARARYNAFKHGLRAETPVEGHENLADYARIRDDLRGRHGPETDYEHLLCDRAALLAWRLDRAVRAEIALVAGPAARIDGDETPPLDPDDPLARTVARAFEAGFGPGGIDTLMRYESRLSGELDYLIGLLNAAVVARTGGVWVDDEDEDEDDEMPEEDDEDGSDDASESADEGESEVSAETAERLDAIIAANSKYLNRHERRRREREERKAARRR